MSINDNTSRPGLFTRAISAAGDLVKRVRGYQDPRDTMGATPEAITPQPGAGRIPVAGNRVTGSDFSSREDFFGPGQPITPMAPPTAGRGRQLDYDVGYNIRIEPKQEGISFQELRALADAHSVTRLLIETRKDQLEALPWQIRPIIEENDVDSKGRKRKATKDEMERARATTDFLRFPDGVTPFGSWMRQLCEDMLVIDAPSCYVNTAEPLNTRFELVDGATLKRVITPEGRTPTPPDVAYQQIIHGLPAWNYSADEMIYLPRNSRPSKIYGYSPVQQIVMIINIALRREFSQLTYFSDGTIPDAFIGVPETWTPEQVQAFQKYWDSIHEGNLAARRKAKFIAGKSNVTFTKEPILKSEFDEWMTRVACYAFSIPPTAFVRVMNRATAQSAKEAAKEEGLAPVMRWSKQFVDRMIQQKLGQYDLEFVWENPSDIDPDVQTGIWDKNLKNGSMTINEVRDERGQDPLQDGDTPLIYAGATVIRLEDAIKEPAPPPIPGAGGLLPPGSPADEPGVGGKAKPVPPARNGKAPQATPAGAAAPKPGQKPKPKPGTAPQASGTAKPGTKPPAGKPPTRAPAKEVGKAATTPFAAGASDIEKGSDDQPRDDHGRWTSGGGQSFTSTYALGQHIEQNSKFKREPDEHGDEKHSLVFQGEKIGHITRSSAHIVGTGNVSSGTVRSWAVYDHRGRLGHSPSKSSAKSRLASEHAKRLLNKLAKYSPDQPRDDDGRFGEGRVSISLHHERTYSGAAKEVQTKLTKQQVGALGEKVVIEYLKSLGLKDAAPLNLHTTNFPVDLVGDHQVFEVKTGLVSNGKSAQQWRATIGQPGKAETAWLKTASAEDKRAWNQQKNQAIMERKQHAVEEFSKKLGTPVHGKTIGVILNPDTKTADVHVFEGFHSRVGWNTPDAHAAYVGTFRYED